MKYRLFIPCLLLLATGLTAQSLYQMRPDSTRWATFENPKTLRGAGGMENKTAKGHAFEPILAGATTTLLDTKGCGVVQRIWLTFDDRSPQMLRSLRLEMYWDGATKPAVSVPLGDFFSLGHGQIMPFENAFFASPEGRSFICTIPMPFRKGARITVTNDSGQKLNKFFYDVDFQLVPSLPADALYFHCHWRRETQTVLGQDFNLLPEVKGRGRLLGVNVGLITAPEYGRSWWGEGEVKIYLDGDGQFPTIVGTGAEDYVGSGWGLGRFLQRNQGCPVAQDTAGGKWAFYRFHVDDPVFFQQKIRATIQLLGGWHRDVLREWLRAGVPLQPVAINTHDANISLLEGQHPDIFSDDFVNGWVIFYRREDYCATSYFYLDRPTNDLPALPAVAVRTQGL